MSKKVGGSNKLLQVGSQSSCSICSSGMVTHAQTVDTRLGFFLFFFLFFFDEQSGDTSLVVEFNTLNGAATQPDNVSTCCQQTLSAEAPSILLHSQ